LEAEGLASAGRVSVLEVAASAGPELMVGVPVSAE
jgi:hypothetical protein